MFRNVWLVLAATLVVAGCSCGETPPAEFSVRILSPLDGATVRSDDDVDAATAGLQIDVQVKASGFSQVTAATLQLDGEDTGLSMQDRGDGTFIFTGLTVAAGPRVLTVHASGVGADGTTQIEDVGIAQLTVELASGDPGLQIAAPAEGALNAAADIDAAIPWLQVNVDVTLAAGRRGELTLCSSSAAQVDAAACAKAPGRVVATAAIDGEATKQFVVTLPDGSADLSVEFKDALSEELFASATAHWSVDTTPPTLAFHAPLANDVVVRTPVPVLLRTSAEPGQVVTVTGGEQPVSQEVPAGGDVVLDVPAAEGTVVLTANVTDRAGNPATAQVSFTLDTQPCELLPVSPAAPVVLYGGGDDKNPAVAGLQVDLVARTGDCKDRLAELYINGSLIGKVPADPLTGEFVFADITIPDGAKELPVSVELQDVAGNLAKLELLVSVQLKAPELVLVTDTSTRNLLTDRDFTTPGIQIQAVVQAAALQGGTVTLCSTVAPFTGAPACRTGGFMAVNPPVQHTALQTQFFGVTVADGAQQVFGEVVDAAGNVSASPQLALVVDSVAPKVASIALVQDSSGGAADGLLSATELPPGQPATFNLSVTGADGQSLSLLTNDGAGPALVSGTVTGGQVTLNAPLADGTHNLLARVVSAGGNPNVSTAPAILNPEARLAVTVDRTPPVLTLVAPATSLNKSHDTVDPATEALETTIEVSTDIAAGRTVQFVADGLPPQNVTVANGRAQLPVSLLSGTHTVEVTAIDLAGNETKRTFTFTVDTLAPTLAFSSPTPNQTIADYNVPVVLDTDAEQGQVVTVTSSSAPGQTWTATVDAASKATLELTLANGPHTLTANVSDKAGNPAPAATVALTITATGCQIAMVAPSSNPARLGASADKDDNPGNGLQLDIRATTLNCAGTDAVLLVNGTSAGTVAAGPTGEILFSDVTFADGAMDVPVAIRMTDLNGKQTEVAFTVSAKLTAPSMTLSPARPASGTLTYVAETNPNVDGTSIIKDLVPGGDADAELGVVINNGQGGTLSIELNGFDLIPPRTIASNAENFGGPLDLIFTQGTDANLVVTVSDPFGNTVSETYRVVVDVQAPAAPAVTATLADNRSAKVELSWTSTGDDGATGNLAGYDIRYLTSSAAGTSFDCPTLDETAFNGTSVVSVSNPPAGGAANQAVAFALEKLPPLNCYEIAVRARDEVGNLSPLTNVKTVRNYWNEAPALEGAASGSLFGLVMVSGDFDGNGADDLAVAARSESPGGAVYIYYGGTSGLSTTPQRFAGTTSGELFGSALAAGDLNGDGIDDLVISASNHAGNVGHVFIHFGGIGQQLDTTNRIELRGRVAGGRFGYSAGIVGDVDGDGIHDLLIAARSDGAAGTVFLFKGRSTASWLSSRTSQDTSTTPPTPYIAASAADGFFVGATAGDQFGARDGFVSLGDLDADGKSEFAIPASRDNVNKLHLYNGAVVNGIVGRNIETTDGVTLTRPAGSILGTLEGFGAYALGGRDFDNDGYPDLLVSQPITNVVALYRGDSAAQAIGGTATTITAPGLGSGVYYGSTMSTADLDGDSKPDLIVGNNAGAASMAGASTVWIHFNSGTSNPFGAPGTTLKKGVYFSSVRTADFNGDSKVDLAVADPSDGKGKVWVYAP